MLGAMAKLLYRLGHLCVRRRRAVLLLWVGLLVGVGIWSSAADGETSESISIPGTESQDAADLLGERFPAQAGTSIRIALEAPEGTALADFGSTEDLEAGMAQLYLLPHVVPLPDPLSAVTFSADGRIAFIEVRFDIDAVDVPKETIEAIIAATEDAAPAVLNVAFSGEAVSKAVAEPHPPSELIGFVVAIVVLLVAFGSVLAMGLPLLTAVIGVLTAILGISLLSAFIELPSVAPTLAIMIGLAVGIDYALFIVTRHRAFHAQGLEPAEAAARANATSGGAVVFAGGTVVIALAGLAVAGIPFVTAMGLCASAAVAIAVLIAITLVPALLGFAGDNIDRIGIPGIKVTTGEGVVVSETFSGRMAKAITDRPVPYVLVGLVLMVGLAVPMLSMRLGLPDDGSKSPETTEREAYDILVDGFGAGFNGPLTVVADLEGVTDATASLDAITALATADPDVAFVSPAIPNEAGDTAIISVIPVSGPASAETEDLVHRLRDGLAGDRVAGTGVTTYVAGTTAANIDISEKIGTALPKYMALVIVLTMLLLLVVFRSILVPIKAAIAILLSIGGALGVVVAIFQWGWAASLIGVDQTVPIVSFVPLLMFGILFGLSMDYEVFILSRIREEYAHTDDAHGSVLTGLASSARVITAAALIMISVFGAFVLGDDVVIKMLGIGLAVAVLLDATVVRMIIVPAVMALFDRKAWWLPRWLQKLPDLDVEGAKLLQHLEATGAGRL
jgi:RND superfamily putative drug exporter